MSSKSLDQLRSENVNRLRIFLEADLAMPYMDKMEILKINPEIFAFVSGHLELLESTHTANNDSSAQVEAYMNLVKSLIVNLGCVLVDSSILRQKAEAGIKILQAYNKMRIDNANSNELDESTEQELPYKQHSKVDSDNDKDSAYSSTGRVSDIGTEV